MSAPSGPLDTASDRSWLRAAGDYRGDVEAASAETQRRLTTPGRSAQASYLRYGDEATLFRLAGQLEAARPWFNRKPPLVG